MTKILVCRVCLVIDLRPHSLLTPPLQDIYEKITNISLTSSEGKPLYVCYICHSQLLNSHKLMTRALRADQTLTDVLQNGIEFDHPPADLQNISNFSISATDSFSYIPITDDENDTVIKTVKIEQKDLQNYNLVDNVDDVKKRDVDEFVDDVKKIDVDVEDVNKIETDGFDDDLKECGDGDTNADSGNQHEPPHNISDSDDNVPLQSISKSNRIKKSRTKKVSHKVKKKRMYAKEKDKVFIEDFAKEIILTKEQQIQELKDRCKSLNYLNSPFRCEMCYKGFVDARAYENHKRKHDERSGAHECEICRMRYSTPRQLRTHAQSSHQRKYQCAKCPVQSHTANQAREHEKWHGGFTYACKLCGQTFTKPTSYLTHKRKRHATQHACDICGGSFLGTHGLLMHRSKVHPGHKSCEERSAGGAGVAGGRWCSQCGARFSNGDAWQRHVLTSPQHRHDNVHSPQCVICGEWFTSASSAASHLRGHEKSLRVTQADNTSRPRAELFCDQCNSMFVNKSKLQAHINRKHLGLRYNKNMVCEVCGKKCSSNAVLQYHQRTHTGEKPYQCEVCNKRFANNNQLRIHTRTHTGERPYGCSVCGKRFSQKPALNRHYRVHTGAKPYTCQFCSKPFSQSNSLKLHVNTVHLKMPANRKHKKPASGEKQQTSDDSALQTL